jgi:imidazolonepropionase-like amidohydrolase
MAIALTGGRLIDGLGGDPLPDATVVVEGERIVGLGRREEVVTPPDSEIIDVTGMTILPGLINAHSHLCWDCVGDLKEQSHWDPVEMVAFKYAMNMKNCLTAGVTTVRDMGAPFHAAQVAVEAVEEGIVPGPRIFYCGRPLSITGGHAFWMGTREADGVDGVRHAVREEIRDGATWIKVMASGSRQEGVSRKGTVWIRSLPEFTMLELRAAADEAHVAGARIAAHATEEQSIRNCVEAGVDSIEHGGPIDDDVLKAMAANGVWLVPTFSPATLQSERGAQIGMPAFEIERRREQLQDKGRSIVKAARAGVRLAMGTDAGSPAVPNSEVAREIELMHETGACETPMAALIAATRNGAELLGKADDFGTLQKGLLADILVVNGDPLDDLGTLRNVSHVFVGGKAQVRDGRMVS